MSEKSTNIPEGFGPATKLEINLCAPDGTVHCLAAMPVLGGERADFYRALIEAAESFAPQDKPKRDICQGTGTFGDALEALWSLLRVGRKGWNGKGMWLQLQIPDANSKMTLPYIYMRTAQGDLVPWLCSQTDALASDWEIVPQ